MSVASLAHSVAFWIPSRKARTRRGKINALLMRALNQLPSSHAQIMTVALPTADYFHGTTIIFGA